MEGTHPCLLLWLNSTYHQESVYQVGNWGVCKGSSLSDHQIITFEVNGLKTFPVEGHLQSRIGSNLTSICKQGTLDISFRSTHPASSDGTLADLSPGDLLYDWLPSLWKWSFRPQLGGLHSRTGLTGRTNFWHLIQQLLQEE